MEFQMGFILHLMEEQEKEEELGQKHVFAQLFIQVSFNLFVIK